MVENPTEASKHCRGRQGERKPQVVTIHMPSEIVHNASWVPVSMSTSNSCVDLARQLCRLTNGTTDMTGTTDVTDKASECA